MEFSKATVGKRICKKISMLILVMAIIFQTNVLRAYAVDVPLGKDNSSDKIYEWVRVRDVEDIVAITGTVEEARKKELRVILIPAVSHGEDKAPGFENYYVIDKGKDRCEGVSLKNNKMIAYDSDVFYTRGGMRTPYMEYAGMSDTNTDKKNAGEAVPTFRLFEAGTDDKKTSNILIGYNTGINEWQTLRKESDLSKIAKEDKDDTWAFSFPAAHHSTKVAKNLGNTTYRKNCEELVALGAVITGVGSKDYSWMTDDYPLTPWDYYLMADECIEGFWDVNEIFFKCYIGICVDRVEKIEETVYVNSGQIKSLSGISYIKRNSVLEVKEGGTLFISGTCINNGIIKNSGGNIIVQKGALITTMDTWGSTSGNIIVSGGEMIIREGARIVNQNKDAAGNDLYMFLVENGGYVLNKGVICLRGNMRLVQKMEMDNEGAVYTGYKLKNDRKAIVGYRPEIHEQSANAYANAATNEISKNVAKENDRYVQLYGYGGVFRNAGINY